MATKLEIVSDSPKRMKKPGAGKTGAKKSGKTARPTPEAAAEKAGRRKERLDRIDAANKITVTLQTDVRRFLAGQAKAEGMDMGHFLQKLVETHILASAPEGDALATRIGARRSVIDHVVKLAQSMEAEGGFDEHFILNVLKRAHADAAFAALYASAVADPEKPKTAGRAAVALNQQLGRLIKRAVHARSKRDDAGKIQRAQVKDEVITSYTLLEKPAA
ncbi:hypothetical protein [Pseudodonghicola flavimaris]|uniref:DUF3486 family protein n=1 Tax=Pseudodonghicola flavimaris TaxID=3050036 RepID=A0ABT7F720_9RHOB|nr:hypothetical protein [Pseudodonghicola flavimaris]MDK3020315.1 hypothetical protein [Pseudodonghicola flavimaris]